MINRSAIRISLIYLVICVCWIISTDYLLSLFVEDLSRLVNFEMIKGIAFLSLSSVLLYILIARAQSSISGSETKYRQIVETANEGIWVIDEYNKTTFVNGRLVEMLGYTKEDMLGKVAFDFVHTEEIPDSIQRMEKRKAGKNDVVEFRLRKKNGGYIKALMSASPIIENGKYIGAVSLVTDVTEWRKTEQELAFTKSNLHHLINSTNDLIWSVDNQFRLLSFNEEFEKRVAEATGKTPRIGDSVFHDVYGQELNMKWRNAFEKALQGKRQTISYKSDEMGSEIEANVNPLESNAGIIVGVACFLKDVTTTKRWEREQFKAILKAEEKERNRIARELHDGLGQHLTAIQLKLNYILSGKEWPVALKQELETALSYVQSASSETEQISSNLLPQHIKDSGLFEAIQDLAIIKDSEIEFKFYQNQESEKLNLSEETKLNLFRIIQEAVHNIIKHSSAKTATIQFTKQKNKLVLIIEDDGKGFDFERSANKKGHFGLHNMLSRSKVLDADIIIDTAPGKGCCLTLYLPLQEVWSETHDAVT